MTRERGCAETERGRELRDGDTEGETRKQTDETEEREEGGCEQVRTMRERERRERKTSYQHTVHLYKLEKYNCRLSCRDERHAIGRK